MLFYSSLGLFVDRPVAQQQTALTHGTHDVLSALLLIINIYNIGNFMTVI